MGSVECSCSLVYYKSDVIVKYNGNVINNYRRTPDLPYGMT